MNEIGIFFVKCVIVLGLYFCVLAGYRQGVEINHVHKITHDFSYGAHLRLDNR